VAKEFSVSILLLNFQQGKYINKALESISMQTVKPKQIILIDDGSSYEEIFEIKSLSSKYSDLPLEVICDQKNLGHTARMNQALSLSTEEFFLLLSADDWLEPDAIELLAREISDSDDVVWGNLRVVNENGSNRGYVRPRENWQGKTARRYLNGGNVFDDLLRVNSFVTGGMSLLRVSTIRNAGGWDPKVTTEDFDLWLRIGSTATFRYVDEVIGNYRQVPNSKSRNDNKKLLDQALIFSKHAGQSKILDRKLAYLAAMRWALAVARIRRLPKVSINQMAAIMGVSTWKVTSQLPRAIWAPVSGSLIVFLKSSLKVFHRG
jgi:glycosyltransferase involved in cell wall biosynthesis